MTPYPSDIVPNAPPPSNPASSTTPAIVSTDLKPQLFGQMSYPFAGALTYGQWATGSTPYGVAAQQPSYPYACFGAATTTLGPQHQSYGQLSYSQIYGQSQVPPRANQAEMPSVSTAAKTDMTPPLQSTTPPLQSTTALNSTVSDTLQSSGGLVQCNAISSSVLNQDENIASQDVSTQLVDILRANPQLASIVLAAMGQAQP